MKHPNLYFALTLCIQLVIHSILVFSINYVLFTLVSNIHTLFQSIIITSVVSLWILFVHFNTLFNYHMAVNVDPGNSKDIPLEQYPQDSDYCLQCEYPIPQFCYHCSICDKCTLQLDHHCPWVSCIGRENRRYFVNFVTYIWVYLGNIVVLMECLPVQEMQNQENDQAIIKVLSTIIFFIMFSFSCFHWALVFKGKSSIRMCKEDKTAKSRKQNIKRVFGVSNLFMCLMPSGRQLTHLLLFKDENVLQMTDSVSNN